MGAGRVENEAEEEVFADVAHRRTAEATRPDDAAQSPLTSVTAALSIATSVPVPMAIPTSAAARAGASLMPSPAMATRRPTFRKLGDLRLFLVRKDLGTHLIDANSARDSFGGPTVVAGHHDDVDSRSLQLPHCFECAFLGWIGHDEQPG